MLCSAIFVIITPLVLNAGEGVEVSFSVQAIRIKDLISSLMSAGAQWTFVAADIDTGARVVSAGSDSRGDVPLSPGSLQKLFVTGAALEKDAKAQLDLSTVIAIDGKHDHVKIQGNVVLIGAGNALLSTKDLLVAVEKLKTLDLSEIGGDVIIDDALFDTRGWKSRYAGSAYGVPAALGLDLHTVSITADRSLQQFVTDPPNDAVKVSFNPSGKVGIRQIDDLTYEVTGAGRDVPVVHNRFSLSDPALFAGGVFLSQLKKQGIAVSGKVKRGVLPAGATEVMRVGSPDITTLIRDTNQQSLNVAADNLLFLLGARTYGAPGTKEKGIKVVNSFLQALDVPLAGMILDDGSGVSERNKISAEQMVTFLREVAKKPWFTTFYEGLSRPGMDGRLKDFGYRSDRIRMKAGQVRDAYCLAGYVDQKSGKRIAFAYMVNGPEADTPVASAVAIEVLKQLEQ